MPSLMSHSLVFLSVAAVASRPGAAGQKDMAQVGLSCAAKRKIGAEPGHASGAIHREHFTWRQHTQGGSSTHGKAVRHATIRPKLFLCLVKTACAARKACTA